MIDHDEQPPEYPKVWVADGIVCAQYGPHAMTITTNAITTNLGGAYEVVPRRTDPPLEAER